MLKARDELSCLWERWTVMFVREMSCHVCDRDELSCLWERLVPVSVWMDNKEERNGKTTEPEVGGYDITTWGWKSKPPRAVLVVFIRLLCYSCYQQVLDINSWQTFFFNILRVVDFFLYRHKVLSSHRGTSGCVVSANVFLVLVHSRGWWGQYHNWLDLSTQQRVMWSVS